MNNNWLNDINTAIADQLKGTKLEPLAVKLNDIRDRKTGCTAELPDEVKELINANVEKND